MVKRIVVKELLDMEHMLGQYPNESHYDTLIEEDKDTMEQFKAFESLIEECADVTSVDNANQKSKWI